MTEDIETEIASLEARVAELRAAQAQSATAQPELMTAREVAEFLRVPLPTVYYLAQNAKIPACRIGGRYRFRRADMAKLLTPAQP